MPSFKLDRRGFLRGLAACLLLPAVIPEKAVEAAEVTPDVWRLMELHPVTFTVNGDGRIGQSDYSNPETRADAFDLGYDDAATSAALLLAADDVQPLMWHLYSEYAEFRDSLPEIDQERWPEEPEDGVEAWVDGLDPLAFANLRQTVHAWLDAEPDYQNEENEYFATPADGDDYAFRFFQSHFPGDPEELLGVIVVEGDRPGSTYYAAELTVSVEEANRRAEAAGIPIRFTLELIDDANADLETDNSPLVAPITSATLPLQPEQEDLDYLLNEPRPVPPGPKPNAEVRRYPSLYHPNWNQSDEDE